MPHSIQSILVVRTDRLGDVVLTLPMLPLLRQCIPGAHISMLLRRYTGEIVMGNTNLDSVVWYDDGNGLVPFGEMVRTLRTHAYDAVIVVHPTARLASMMLLSGIPMRIGTGYRPYSLLFNRRVYEHRKDARKHELEYNCSLLGALGCTVPAFPLRPDFGIQIPDDIALKVETILAERGIRPGGRRVILHPGSGGSARDWPLQNFAQLASRLGALPDVSLVGTGSQSEFVLVQELVREVPGGMVNLAGLFTVRELAALIRSATLFVSNSTGPLHIAAAVGTPVLGFYPAITAMSARRWGPYTGRATVLVPERPPDCRKCRRPGEDRCECMESITVEKAHEAALALLVKAERGEPMEIPHAS